MASTEKSGDFDFKEPGVPTFEPAATPRERLRQVFEKNALDLRSFEFQSAKVSAWTSFFVGVLVGGTKTQRVAQETWKKNHAHSLFLNNKDAASFLMDYHMRRFIYDGTRYGFKVAAVSGIMMLTAGCLAARRDQARVTDIGIGGCLASALYRIDVGPRAMLASGIIGGVFWQMIGFTILSVGWMKGYSFDGLYKQMRKEYYEIMNARIRYRRELHEIANETDELLSPSEVKERWTQRKLQQEHRLAVLQANSTGERSVPTTPKSEDANQSAHGKRWWQFW